MLASTKASVLRSSVCNVPWLRSWSTTKRSNESFIDWAYAALKKGKADLVLVGRAQTGGAGPLPEEPGDGGVGLARRQDAGRLRAERGRVGQAGRRSQQGVVGDRVGEHERQTAGQLVAVERPARAGRPFGEVQELRHLEHVVDQHGDRLAEAGPRRHAGPVLVEQLGTLGGRQRPPVGAGPVRIEEGVDARFVGGRCCTGSQLRQDRRDLQRHVLGGEHQLLGSACPDVVEDRFGREAGDRLADRARVLAARSEAAAEHVRDGVLILERGQPPGVHDRGVGLVVADVAAIRVLRRRRGRWWCVTGGVVEPE